MPLKFLARPCPPLTRMAGLILVAAGLLGSGSLTTPSQLRAAERSDAVGSKERTNPLKVQVSTRLVQPGASFQVTVENHTNEPIFLPGCAPYSLEKFGQDHFEPVAHKRCDWEQAALSIPPGPKTFELTAPELPENSPNGWIMRVPLAYGQGCLVDRTLSTAQCKVLSSASSPTFILREAPEE